MELTHHFKLPMSSNNSVKALITIFIIFSQLKKKKYVAAIPIYLIPTHTLMPFTSSSLKDPMSKVSAAFTSPLGGTKGGFN